MALFDLISAGDALEDMLDRERAAILAGRFDVLERLAAEKERLFATVLRQNTDTETLERLRRGAERNQVLLAAMDNGIRAATRLIERMRYPPEMLTTYDATGQRSAIDSPDHALHRRA